MKFDLLRILYAEAIITVQKVFICHFHTSNTALMQPSFSGLFVTCAYLPAKKERINGMICKQDFIIIINSFKK